MKLITHLLLTLALSASAVWGHGHINAGAQDTNGTPGINFGDPLYMYFEHGTATTPLLYNGGANLFGTDGYNWDGYITLTALHQSSDIGEAPNYNSLGALSGSFLVLTINSIIGPDGATFAFYDSDINEDPFFSFSYEVGTGLAGTGSFALTSDLWAAVDDPYGHIHGRRFAVDTAGSYTVNWTLSDLNAATTGMQAYSFNQSFFAEPVPEPSTAVLLLTGAGAAWMFKRRRSRQA